MDAVELYSYGTDSTAETAFAAAWHMDSWLFAVLWVWGLFKYRLSSVAYYGFKVQTPWKMHTGKAKEQAGVIKIK